MVYRCGPFRVKRGCRVRTAHQTNTARVIYVVDNSVIRQNRLTLCSGRNHTRVTLTGKTSLIVRLPPPCSYNATNSFTHTKIRVTESLNYISLLSFKTRYRSVTELASYTETLGGTRTLSLSRCLATKLACPTTLSGTVNSRFSRLLANTGGALTLRCVGGLLTASVGPLTVGHAAPRSKSPPASYCTSTSCVQKGVLSNRPIRNLMPYSLPTGRTEVGAIRGTVVFELLAVSPRRLDRTPCVSSNITRQMCRTLGSTTALRSVCACTGAGGIARTEMEQTILLSTLKMGTRSVSGPITCSEVLTYGDQNERILAYYGTATDVTLSSSLTSLRSLDRRTGQRTKLRILYSRLHTVTTKRIQRGRCAQGFTMGK